MRFSLVLIIIIALFGCAQLLKLQGQSAEKASQAIEVYCKNTDEKFRSDFLNAVNVKAAPNSIAIICTN